MHTSVNTKDLEIKYLPISDIPVWKLFGVRNTNQIGVVIPNQTYAGSKTIFWMQGVTYNIGYDVVSRIEKQPLYQECFILDSSVEVTLSN